MICSTGLIKQFEGCKLEAYQDQVGVWTIGYGHTGMCFGSPVDEGLSITQEVADLLLQKDIENYGSAIDNIVDVALSENQFAALVSFAFNLGTEALRKSTLLSLVNEGEMDAAAEEFLKWDHAGGKVVPGLLRRREAERDLFLTPDAPEAV